MPKALTQKNHNLQVDKDSGPSPSSSSPDSGTSVSTGSMLKVGHGIVVEVGSSPHPPGGVKSVLDMLVIVIGVSGGSGKEVGKGASPPELVVETGIEVVHSPGGPCVMAGHGGNVRVRT